MDSEPANTLASCKMHFTGDLKRLNRRVRISCSLWIPLAVCSVTGTGVDPFAQCPNLDCGEIAAVMAMATARVEPNYAIFAFDDTFSALPITEKTSLPEVMRIISGTVRMVQPTARSQWWKPIDRGWRNIEGFAIYTR